MRPICTAIAFALVSALSCGAASDFRVVEYSGGPPLPGEPVAIISMAARFPDLSVDDSVYIEWANAIQAEIARVLTLRGYVLVGTDAVVGVLAGHRLACPTTVTHPDAKPLQFPGGWFGFDEEAAQMTSVFGPMSVSPEGLNVSCTSRRVHVARLARDAGAVFGISAVIDLDRYGCPARCRVDVHHLQLQFLQSRRRFAGFDVQEPPLDLSLKQAPPSSQAWQALIFDAMNYGFAGAGLAWVTHPSSAPP